MKGNSVIAESICVFNSALLYILLCDYDKCEVIIALVVLLVLK